MEHSFIDEHDVVSRYVAGHLSEEQAREFEAHFVDCPTCLRKLEIEQEFRAGLMAVRDGRPTAISPSRRRGLSVPLTTLAAAAALVIAAGATFGYLQVRRQLDATRVQVAALQRESAEARARADAVARTAAPEPPRPTSVAGEVGRIAVVDLETTRSVAPGPLTPVTLSPATSLVVFNLGVGDVKEYSRLAATLETARGAVIIRQDNLQPASPTSVAIAVDAAMLLAGDYTIVLEGEIRDRPAITIARFPFRLIRR